MNKPRMAIVLEEGWDSFGGQNCRWSVSQDLNSTFDFKNQMYHDMSTIACDPRWEECCKSKEKVPADLMQQFNDSMAVFVKLLGNEGCHPSLS